MNRKQVFNLALFSLPVLVAAAGWSVVGALFATVLFLLWRWGISLATFMAPQKLPALELESISASHFVEKVRWAMDRLGLDYVERPMGGTLGAFFLGRTVPRLNFSTGAVRSSIGNSPEILRYLWGRYGDEHGDRARFLKPTSQRQEIERRIDRCGVDLQVWVYHHILPDRQLTLHAWGCNSLQIPVVQRRLLSLLYPLLRALIRKSFRITPAHFKRARQHIEVQLAEFESEFSGGALALGGESEPSYVDYSFAAIHGLWLQPPGFGGGQADAVRIDRARAPAAMRRDIEDWSARYPLCTARIESLYEHHRKLGSA